jgi:hypothetical protein
MLLTGCAALDANKHVDATASAKAAEHPSVVIQGVDGTLMAGELLNGAVTVDSGQGELTLLTDHIHTIVLAQDVDKVDSDSIKVSGKIKDSHFMLRNEHGVFPLMKERLKKIDFITNPPPVMATADPKAPLVKSTAPAN